VGDIVYISQRYPRDPKKPFMQMTIVEVKGVVLAKYGGHAIAYELNGSVQAGKRYYVGEEYDGDDSYRLAQEEDFAAFGSMHFDGINLSAESFEVYVDN